MNGWVKISIIYFKQIEKMIKLKIGMKFIDLIQLFKR